MIWENIPEMSLDIPLCLMRIGKILAKSNPYYRMISQYRIQLVFFISFSPDHEVVKVTDVVYLTISLIIAYSYCQTKSFNCQYLPKS